MSTTERPQEIVARSPTALVPLSFGQERLFLLDRMMPGVAAYNVPRTFRVHGTLEIDALQHALNGLVSRHEILRTVIVLEDGEPVPRVLSSGHVELSTLDLRDTPANRGVKARDFVSAVANTPFDLSRDIMLRAGLVHLEPGEDLLVLVNHHVVSDHASGGIILKEIDALYRAFRETREPELAALPIQYGDFARWQREKLSGGALAELVDFWRHQLADAPSRLDLPADRLRPPALTYAGELYEFKLTPELSARVQTLARTQAASVFMILVATFNALLHRYTGTDDIVIGTPVSGRSEEELNPLVGFFTNTLVLRTDLSGNPTFADLIARVKAMTLESLAYQDLPFEKLVEALNPDRAQSYSPIFQVMLGFDLAPATPTLGVAVLDEVATPGWRFSRLDLSLNVRQHSNGELTGSVEYSTDLFDRSTIERLVGHFKRVIAIVVENPQERIDNFGLLTEAERETLEHWNETTASFPAQTLHELVLEQARRTPDAIAVESGDESLTYAELDERSHVLAAYLRECSVETGSLIGVCMDRSTDLLVSLLAVLRVGAAYVPIDPTYPADRQAFMLADAGCPLVLTQGHLLERLAPSSALAVCVDRDWAEISSVKRAILGDAPCDADALAYVIYTSGSTGRPKGVEIDHRALVNFLLSMLHQPGLSSSDVLIAVTTLSFDIAGLELYLPLLCGAKVVIAPTATTSDPQALAALLEGSGATVMQATPATWRMLVDNGWPGVPGLKALCGGEALPPALADELLARDLELWNMYGPTETTIWSAAHRLRPNAGAPVIGRPIANTRFYVVDRFMTALPVGVPGELIIGGAGVARGYHKRAEMTAEKFVPDPFVVGRAYRTGDLVRWTPDGTLEFLGRLDQQVKLRGFRIELGEVEAALGGHPAVAACAAAAREDVAGEKFLVGYAVIDPETAPPPTSESLRRYLSQSLPAYAVPSLIVVVDELPVTANGKLDRNALPDPAEIRLALEHPYVAARTPLEARIVELWERLLPVERVGINDSFVDLGGHSLLALKLLARVQDAFDVDLPLTTIFEAPTPSAFTEVVSSRLVAAASEDDDLSLLLSEVEGLIDG